MVRNFLLTGYVKLGGLLIDAKEPKGWKEILFGTKDPTEDQYKLLGAELSATQLKSLIRTLLIVGISGFALVLIGVFAYGAILWTTAGDNEEKVKKGQKVAKGGLYGLLIFAGSVVVLGLMAQIFGISISDKIFDVFDDVLK